MGVLPKFRHRIQPEGNEMFKKIIQQFPGGSHLVIDVRYLNNHITLRDRYKFE